LKVCITLIDVADGSSTSLENGAAVKHEYES
jgi:hypothetical protein